MPATTQPHSDSPDPGPVIADPAPSVPLVYEERRTWTLRPICSAVIGATFLIGGIALALTTSAWQFAAFGALWAFITYPVVAGAISHALVLRVDDTGITLYGTPRSLHPGPNLTPWDDVDAIKLLPVQSRLGTRSGSALYVRTTTDTIDDELPARDWWPDAPGRFLSLSNWRIDTHQLAATTRRYAPTATIIDKR